ncbi:MAG: guanylate kinase [Chlamydiae bacterium]|nr:MAG: guanylate kinase [Chlamydiota bacterium]
MKKSDSKAGNLFVITAPSGAGKTTLRNYLLKKHPDLYFSVSATTRQKRPGEIIHKDYHFISQEEYNNHLKNNNFLESAEVFGNYYGTLKHPIIERLKKGINVLLDVDTKGAKQVKQKLPDAVLIFIEPPSMEELEHRLRSRGTESEEAICKRLREAEFEMAQRDFFDYRVVNDNLEEAQKEIENILYSKKI